MVALHSVNRQIESSCLKKKTKDSRDFINSSHPLWIPMVYSKQSSFLYLSHNIKNMGHSSCSHDACIPSFTAVCCILNQWYWAAAGITLGWRNAQVDMSCDTVFEVGTLRATAKKKGVFSRSPNPPAAKLGAYLRCCWLPDNNPAWALLVLMGYWSIGRPLVQEPLGCVDTAVFNASFLFKLFTHPIPIMEIAPAGFICGRLIWKGGQ